MLADDEEAKTPATPANKSSSVNAGQHEEHARGGQGETTQDLCWGREEEDGGRKGRCGSEGNDSKCQQMPSPRGTRRKYFDSRWGVAAPRKEQQPHRAIKNQFLCASVVAVGPNR